MNTPNDTAITALRHVLADIYTEKQNFNDRIETVNRHIAQEMGTREAYIHDISELDDKIDHILAAIEALGGDTAADMARLAPT